MRAVSLVAEEAIREVDYRPLEKRTFADYKPFWENFTRRLVADNFLGTLSNIFIEETKKLRGVVSFYLPEFQTVEEGRPYEALLVDINNF